MACLIPESDKVKQHLTDPLQVAGLLGLTEGAKRQSSGLLVRCPWHAENTPSCSLTLGPDGTLRTHCFGCGGGGDVLALVAAVRGLELRRDFPRILEEAAALCSASVEIQHLKETRPVPPAATRPPSQEVTAMWSMALLVCEAPPLSRQLFARGLDPAVIADCDLARVLPPDGALPSWAVCGGRSWRDSGHHLLVPLFGPRGELASLHARSFAADVAPKGLSPAEHSTVGLVMACPLSRSLLAHGVPEWWPSARQLTVIIVEGVPDFLTVATHFAESAELAPATLGIISGAWSDAIAARIPSSCRVVLRLHGDSAGERYLRTVAESLHARCAVEVAHG